jgi:excisionase family DNA binding protein
VKNQKMLSPREAAQRLGISLNAVYALIWAGKMPAERHANRWLLSVAAIEARLTRRSLVQHPQGDAGAKPGGKR